MNNASAKLIREISNDYYAMRTATPGASPEAVSTLILATQLAKVVHALDNIDSMLIRNKSDDGDG